MELIKLIKDEDILVIEDYRYDKEELKEIIKDITGIKEQYNIGDTAVLIEDVKLNGLYKDNWNGKTFYYIVLKVLNKDLGYAISLWR